MAAIAVLKAAIEADKGVRKFVPGGWKTVIIGVLLIAIVVPMVAVYAVFSSIGTSTKPDGFCATSTTVTEGEDKHGEGTSSGTVDTGYGSKPAPNVPFPTEASTTIVWPVNGAVARSSYGPRTPIYINGHYTNSFHDGTDFSSPMGTPILSMSDGIVSMSRNATGTAEGSMVEIQHNIGGEKYTTAYRHVQGKSIKVKVGDAVAAGTQIASVGSEGYSTGPHLHFVLARGAYHRYNSGNSPAGTIDALAYLKSNGAASVSGGLEGDDFSQGFDPEKAGDEVCGVSNSDTLQGDGTTKWNSYENGEFPEDALGHVGKFELYADAAMSLTEMLAKYKKDTGKSMEITQGYLSKGAQTQRYNDNKQIEKPGQSVFGWARIVELKIGGRDSLEYKWLVENAKDYGFEQPSMFGEGSTSDNPRMWGYKGGGGASSAVPPASNATAQQNRDTAKSILQSDHPTWGNNEYACLVNLWEHESGWNHKAANPTSSARGIAQTMMSIHFGANWSTSSEGRAFLNSPDLQIRWGLEYITGRYDTPCKAWAFWNETDPAKKGGHGGTWY